MAERDAWEARFFIKGGKTQRGHDYIGKRLHVAADKARELVDDGQIVIVRATGPSAQSVRFWRPEGQTFIEHQVEGLFAEAFDWITQFAELMNDEARFQMLREKAWREAVERGEIAWEPHHAFGSMEPEGKQESRETDAPRW